MPSACCLPCKSAIAVLIPSSPNTLQCILTGGKASSSAMSVFLISVASLRVLPFTHSVNNDDEAIAAGWARLEAKGLASNRTINQAGRTFRMELEDRTNALTAPAWQAVGEEETIRFCELVEPYHEAFLDRINATAGPRWMPASRVQRRPKRSSEIRADRSLG